MIDQNMPKLNEVDVFRMSLIMHIASLAIADNMAESEILEIANEMGLSEEYADIIIATFRMLKEENDV